MAHGRTHATQLHSDRQTHRRTPAVLLLDVSHHHLTHICATSLQKHRRTPVADTTITIVVRFTLAVNSIISSPVPAAAAKATANHQITRNSEPPTQCPLLPFNLAQNGCERHLPNHLLLPTPQQLVQAHHNQILSLPPKTLHHLPSVIQACPACMPWEVPLLSQARPLYHPLVASPLLLLLLPERAVHKLLLL